MLKVTVHEAKTHLSRLINRAMDGEEVIISRGKQPLIRLVPIDKPRKVRVIGDYADKIELSDDFEAPLEDFEDYR